MMRKYRTFLPDEVVGISGHIYRLSQNPLGTAVRLSSIQSNYELLTTSNKTDLLKQFFKQVISYFQKGYIEAEIALHASHKMKNDTQARLGFVEVMEILFNGFLSHSDHPVEPVILFSPGVKFEILKQHLVTYITAFEEGEFVPFKKNYYSYPKQKDTFLRFLQEKYTNYGDIFILCKDDIPGHQQILFHHMITVLEHEKAIEIVDTRAYECVLRLLKKEPEGNLIETFSQFTFEGNVLLFSGKALDIPGTFSKKLLATLFSTSRPISEFWEVTEIYEDWEYDTDETLDASSKRRIYHAWKKINRAVRLQTSLKGFIEKNPLEEKYRLNPIFFNKR